jgi:hypothetical protein
MANLVQRKPLIRYLPDFIKQFGEFQEIMKAEDSQFDRMDLNVQRVLNNAFIEDADEYGIKKYETLLGIIPSAEDTLESRRSRVLLRWNDKVPYTYRTLILKLNTLCGVNNYDITGNQEDYYLHFSTYLSLFGQVKELEEYLEKTLPENIYYESENTLNVQSNGSAIIASGTVISDFVEITNDFKENVGVSGNTLIGASVVDSVFATITEDYKENIIIQGNSIIGNGVVSADMSQATNDFQQNLQVDGQMMMASGTVEVDFVEINN